MVESPPDVPIEQAALARPNVFEIDLTAIARAIGAIRDLVGPTVSLFAALKSNAYGFGLVEVARVAVDAGVNGLAVGDRTHAIMLRKNGVTAPILLYLGNSADLAGVRADQEFDLIPTITQLSVGKLYSQYSQRLMRVAVKIDVGNERLGVPSSDAAHFIRELVQLPNLEPYIINAHVGVSADFQEEYLKWQYERFLEVCETLDRQQISVPIKMFASSQVLQLTPSMALTGVDPGSMLLGLSLGGGPKMRRAFHALKSRIVHLRALARTEFLEQAPFPIRAGMRLGVVPIGTSDGMGSLHCGEVLVRGKRVKILGKPDLEYTRIDLTDVPDALINDEVVIIGQQGQTEITEEEVVAYQRLNGRLELATAVRSTIPRRYLR